MMTSSNTIFTIQTNPENTENIVGIETVITNGLYKFTLLGIQSKFASDTKDRVYSALRSSKLLNLKSDNRKIIVNLSPDDTDKKEGFYDLGIALSLLSCIDKNIPNIPCITLGGLSISGKILPSKRLKQGIYTAYANNIRFIICSSDDIEYLSESNTQLLRSFNIEIFHAETLKDIVEILKTKDFDSVTPCKAGDVHSEITKHVKQPLLDFSQLDPLTRAALIALCGGHHLLIQTSLTRSVKELCESISQWKHYNQFGIEIYNAFRDKLLDSNGIFPYTCIENIKNQSKNKVESIQSPYKGSVLALYTPCSCGYQYSFFESNTPERKCICSRRTILQHKRYIESSFFDIFNMHIVHTAHEFTLTPTMEATVEQVKMFQFKRYIEENCLTAKDIFLFPTYLYLNQYRELIKIEQNLDPEAEELWQEYKSNIKILQVAQTIQDMMDCAATYSIKKPAISKQALILALSYIPKMDF